MKKDENFSRLAEFREHLGLLQKEMAAKLGVSRGMWSSYERGLAPVPDMKLQVLESRLGLNLDWYATGRGDPVKKRHSEQEYLSLEKKVRVLEDELVNYKTTMQEELDRYRRIVDKLTGE